MLRVYLSKSRLVARVDIKNQHVIKGIQFDGLRKLGNPNEFAKKYYLDNIDEIVFMDAVASLYDRNSLYDIIVKACSEIFIPITVGGGIRSISDIQTILDSGADKVSINTQAIRDPLFITRASRVFGKQCVVGSIEAKKVGNIWEAYIDNGREKTHKNAISWALELEKLGAGEILLTSVDTEGTQNGFDIELINQLENKLNIPLLVSGGAGRLSHIDEVCKKCKFEGLVVGSMLHYNNSSIKGIKDVMRSNNLRVR